MTDAQEIIAQYLCDRAGQGWSGISTFERAAYRTAAHGMIATLTTAGFRILGPDEVDPVTLEKAASCGDAWSNPSALRFAAGEMTGQELRTAQAVARGIAAAIRAIGRKA